MKNFKSLSLINVVSFLLLVILSNCKKEEISFIQSPEEKPLTVKSGIIYFKDRCAFENTMYMLHSKGQEYLATWEKEIGFDNSLRSSMEMDAENSNPDEEIISDPFFAAVINEDGIFAIGDSLHQLTFDIEYVTSKENLSILKEFKRDNKRSLSQKNSKIVEFPIVRSFQNNEGLKSVSGTHYEKVWSPCGYEPISAHLYYWCTNTLAYASIGIKIVGRKRSGTSCTGTFVNEKMGYAKVKGFTTFRLNWGDPENSEEGENDDTNETTVSKTLTWVLFNVLTCESIHAEYDYQVSYNCASCTQHYTRLWD
jgi:hypothetical protein